jgi:hypothetical protein
LWKVRVKMSAAPDWRKKGLFVAVVADDQELVFRDSGADGVEGVAGENMTVDDWAEVTWLGTGKREAEAAARCRDDVAAVPLGEGNLDGGKSFYGDIEQGSPLGGTERECLEHEATARACRSPTRLARYC